MVDAMNHFSFHQVHIFCNLFSLHLFLFSYPFQILRILILPRIGFYALKSMYIDGNNNNICKKRNFYVKLLKCVFTSLNGSVSSSRVFKLQWKLCFNNVRKHNKNTYLRKFIFFNSILNFMILHLLIARNDVLV